MPLPLREAVGLPLLVIEAEELLQLEALPLLLGCCCRCWLVLLLCHQIYLERRLCHQEHHPCHRLYHHFLCFRRCRSACHRG